jgi:hypothetical protein
METLLQDYDRSYRLMYEAMGETIAKYIVLGCVVFTVLSVVISLGNVVLRFV